MAPRRTRARVPAGQPDGGAPDADPTTVARNICLRLLTGQPRTRADLAEALRRRNVPDTAIAAVLDRFTEVGLINDSAFATAWVRSRHLGRGLSRRALAEELRRRGVAAETITAAVAEVDSDTELETARVLVRRRLPALATVAPPARSRRLLNYLARRGYPAAVAASAIREVLAEPANAELVGVEITAGLGDAGD